MSVVLSVDPGIRGCGCALFRDGVLVAAGYARSSAREGSGPRECAWSAFAAFNWSWSWRRGDIDELVLEWPQIYQRGAGKSKGDPNLLLPLAGVDAALAALLPHAQVHYGVPHDWKGGVQKPKSAKEPYAIEGRVRSRLSPEELSVIEWPNAVKLTWDVTDAVGIGLKHIGRFERQRVYARE